MAIVPEPIESYAAAHSTAESEVLAALAAHTRAATPAPGMMTGHLEGRFLEMLVFAVQPTLVVEVGTFTGYGSISMASVLSPGGRVITCDVNEATTAVARKFAEEAGVADRIEFRLGPALDTIATIAEPIDLAFIDADKSGYRDYFDAILAKLSPHGLIAIDNVLWGGSVVEPPRDDERPDTQALRELNDELVRDERIVCVMTTIRDGVTLVRKRTEGYAGSGPAGEVSGK
jgi:caffeoyl-CoA O-methyltransferase